jgi:hypothetical protein
VGVRTGHDARSVSLGEVVALTDCNRMLASYRFFGVNADDKVLWDETVDCLDDDEARATATTRSLTGGPIEVWEVARFVGRCDVTMTFE